MARQSHTIAADGTKVPRVHGGAARRYKSRYSPLLALPLLVFYVLIFLGPLSLLIVFSFGKQVGFGTVRVGFFLDNFHQLLTPLYEGIYLRTLVMATLGTLLTVLVGYPVAYWMARFLEGSGRTLALVLVIFPFWTSFLMRTYAWKIILGWTGWLYTPKAIGVGLVYDYLPLLVLPTYAALERMDWTLVAAARDLGASPWGAFRQITLRVTAPGLLTGILLVFIPMAGEYAIPAILGGGTIALAGNVIGDQFLSASNWPFGSAAALGLVVLLLGAVALYLKLAPQEQQFGA
jgi:spermidine/putrescine transport system permease protein